MACSWRPAARPVLRATRFTNNSIIEAGDLSFVRLDQGTSISGGTLTTSGSGEILTTQNQSVSLANLAISSGSNYVAENNSTTYTVGKLTNNGTFTLTSTGDGTILNTNSAAVEWAGTGDLSSPIKPTP